MSETTHECRGYGCPACTKAMEEREAAEAAAVLVALETAADALRSAATYLRHVNAFAFAEQVEIDEKHARAAIAKATGGES